MAETVTGDERLAYVFLQCLDVQARAVYQSFPMPKLPAEAQ